MYGRYVRLDEPQMRCRKDLSVEPDVDAVECYHEVAVHLEEGKVYDYVFSQ